MPNREDLRATLLALLEDEMGESYPVLADDQDLRETLGLDSVDVVGLVMRIEREFRIRLAAEELATTRTVGELLDLTEAKIAAGPVAPLNGTLTTETGTSPNEPEAIRNPDNSET